MKNLTEGNIYKTFLLFALPLILSGILTQAHNTIDSMIAGKYLGETGLAAIGGTSSYITLVSSLLWGYGMGSSIYTAMLFASKDYGKLKVYLYNNVLFFICINILIMFVSFVLKDTIFEFLKLDTSIVADASIYYYIICAGLIITSLNTMGVLTMHALGISAFPLKISVISALLNVAGNILSIVVLKIGVAGVAISTLVAAAVANICYVAKLKECFKRMKCDGYKVGINLSDMKKALAAGLPSSMQQSIMYIASMIISPLVNGIGVSATAAYSVVLKIHDINAGVYQNSSKTLTNYTAQCVGAGTPEKLNKGVKVGFLQAMMFLTPVVIVCVIFANPLCRAFFPGDYSGEALNYAVVFVKYFMPFILFNAVNNLFHSLFRGVKANGLLVTFTAIGAVIRVIASFALVPLCGMLGVYTAWIISWIGEAVLIVITYFSDVWKRAIEA